MKTKALLFIALVSLSCSSDTQPKNDTDMGFESDGGRDSTVSVPDVSRRDTFAPDMNADIDLTGAASCRPNVGGVYPDGVGYVGVHANPQNNDFVDCDLSFEFEFDWQVLKGRGIAQPNAFSPDGDTIYVTASSPAGSSCTFFALDSDNGEERWCVDVAQALYSSPLVDHDGNIYLAGATSIASYDPSGNVRWTRSLPSGAIGTHFTPEGEIITVTPDGVLALIQRDDGSDVASISLQEATGFDTVEGNPSGLQFRDLPRSVLRDLISIFGASQSNGLSVFAGASGNFVDNTVAVSPSGDSFFVTTGRTSTDGAIVRVARNDGELAVSQHVELNGSSAASPVLSQDGRWLKASDGVGRPGQASIRIFDLQNCDQPVCTPTFETELAAPMAGASPVWNDGLHMHWESSLANAFGTTAADLRAFRGEDELWSLTLPDDRIWSSVITATRNAIVGTATRLTPSETTVGGIALPRTADSVLVVVNRQTGEIEFEAPISDDSTASVTVGPDGSLYVGLLTLLHSFATETRPVGGLVKFSPR